MPVVRRLIDSGRNKNSHISKIVKKKCDKKSPCGQRHTQSNVMIDRRLVSSIFSVFVAVSSHSLSLLAFCRSSNYTKTQKTDCRLTTTNPIDKNTLKAIEIIIIFFFFFFCCSFGYWHFLFVVFYTNTRTPSGPRNAIKQL